MDGAIAIAAPRCRGLDAEKGEAGLRQQPGFCIKNHPVQKKDLMMNSKSPIADQATLANILAALTAHNAPRALLVSFGLRGELVHQPVEMGTSLIRLEHDLTDHLSSRPLPTEFFENLRDYCNARLAARAEARRSGGFVVPAQGKNSFHIAHVPAFERVEVAQ